MTLKNHINHRAAVLILYFLLLAGAIFALEDFIVNSSAHFGAYLAEHTKLGALAFMVLAAISIIGGPFTSAPLVPSALVAWGHTATLLLLFSGWLIGNSVAYAIGYHFGYPVVHRLFSKEKFHQWIAVANKHVTIEFLFLVRLAVPSEIGYLFGLVRYDFLKYILVTFFAELPVVFLLVYAGDAFIRSNWPSLFFIGVVWAAIMFTAFRTVRKMNA